jgi:hypothetical protein
MSENYLINVYISRCIYYCKYMKYNIVVLVIPVNMLVTYKRDTI